MKTVTTLLTFGSMAIAAGMMLGACDNGVDENTVAVDANDLGITGFQIDHTPDSNGDQLLTIRGLDDQAEVIATATLRTGLVWYGADVESDWHAGTELGLRVGEVTTNFTSPDRVPHKDVIPPGYPTLDSFVALHAVAAAIDREAGIQMVPQSASTETSYNGAACTTSHFKSGSSQCCEDGQYIFQLSPHNGLVNRYGYDATYPVCRNSSGAVGCTGTACQYGPCGTAVNKWASCHTNTGTACGIDTDCPSGDYCQIADNTGVVFIPTTTNFCGWDKSAMVTTGGTKNVDWNPEQYGSQTKYGPVTAGCPFPTSTQCTPTGHPANGLTGTIPAHGTGKFGAYGELTSSVGGLDVTNNSGAGAGSVSIQTNTGVTVTACPDSGDATATISGACTATVGAAGNCVQCTISNITLDKAVNATFGCTIEFGC